MNEDTVLALLRIATWALSIWTGIVLLERLLAWLGSPRFHGLRTGTRLARTTFSLPGLAVAAALSIGAHVSRGALEDRLLDQSDLSGIDVQSSASLFRTDSAWKDSSGRKVSTVDAKTAAALKQRYGDGENVQTDCSAPAAPPESVR